MAEQTALSTREKLERLKSRLAAAREQSAEAVELGVTSVMAVAGGATSGVIQQKMPLIKGTKIPTDVALGSALVFAALFKMGGKFNNALNSYGGGILAGAAAREAQKALAEKE